MEIRAHYILLHYPTRIFVYGPPTQLNNIKADYHIVIRFLVGCMLQHCVSKLVGEKYTSTIIPAN